MSKTSRLTIEIPALLREDLERMAATYGYSIGEMVTPWLEEKAELWAGWHPHDAGPLRKARNAQGGWLEPMVDGSHVPESGQWIDEPGSDGPLEPRVKARAAASPRKGE